MSEPADPSDGGARPAAQARVKEHRWRPRAVLERILWIAALGYVAYAIWPQLGAALGVGTDGPVVADVRVTTLTGGPIALADLRGQVVLVNFWATWCPPCRVEMPGFENVWREYRDEGFTVLALSTDRGPRSAVRRFVEERDLTFPVAMANGDAVRAFGSPRALPMSFLIDRQGRIRHTVRGLFAGPALEQAVVRLLAEEPGAGPDGPLR